MLQIQTLVRNVRSQAERGLAKKLLVPLLERIRYSSSGIRTCKNPAKLRSCEIIIDFFVLGVEKIHNGINEENISIFPWAGVDSWNFPGRFLY